MKSIILNIAVVILLLLGFANANSSNSFTWLKPGDNTQLFQEIEKAFLDELQPDIPEEVRSYIPILYKYIARIGIFRNSCIVLIGYREHANDPEEYDYFKAFSYDRVNFRKSEILPKGVFFKWSFVGLYSFEPSPTPDVVFKYYICLECEWVETLSSFRFDPEENKWNMRIWPDNDSRLLIGSAPQYGDDIWIYDCLHSIADFNSDGFTDIVIRCRETGSTTKVVTDEVFLYTIQKGIAKKIKVHDKKKLAQLNSILCKGQKSPLCK